MVRGRMLRWVFRRQLRRCFVGPGRESLQFRRRPPTCNEKTASCARTPLMFASLLMRDVERGFASYILGIKVNPWAENTAFPRFSAYQTDGIELRKLGA